MVKCIPFDSGANVAGIIFCTRGQEHDGLCYRWVMNHGFIRWDSSTGRKVSLDSIIKRWERNA